MAARKGFEPGENDLARRMVRDLIKQRGGQQAAADALGVTQSYLSDFLSERRGGGTKILKGLARLQPESGVALMMGQPAPEYTKAQPPAWMVAEPDTVERELATPEAKRLEAEFLPSLEESYPGLGKSAIRGLRARRQLRGYDLRTLWEALATVRFEERGVKPTSLGLINLAQARVLDEGDTEDAPAPVAKPKPTKKKT
jgi:transcriptional regulator with XRE-family HTH domain